MENGTLPTAGYQTHTQITVPLKYLYGRISLTGPAMELAHKNISAFVDSKTSEMDGIVADVTRDFNRQMHGDGTGVICQCNGAGSGATALILDKQTVGPTVAYYLQGIPIDIKTTATGGSLEVSGVTVSAVVSDTATAATVTLGTSSTWSDDSYVFRTGNQGNEIVGLLGAIDDGGLIATYMGVDRTAAGNQYWQANDQNNSGTPRNFTETLFDGGFLECLKKGTKPTHAITAFTPFKTLGAALVAYKKFDVSGGSLPAKLPGGYLGMSVNGIDVIADIDCQKGNCYIFDAKAFTIYQPLEPGFIDYTGSPWIMTPSVDAYTMTLRHYVSLFLDKPAGACVIRDLQ